MLMIKDVMMKLANPVMSCFSVCACKRKTHPSSCMGVTFAGTAIHRHTHSLLITKRRIRQNYCRMHIWEYNVRELLPLSTMTWKWQRLQRVSLNLWMLDKEEACGAIVGCFGIFCQEVSPFTGQPGNWWWDMVLVLWSRDEEMEAQWFLLAREVPCAKFSAEVNDSIFY